MINFMHRLLTTAILLLTAFCVSAQTWSVSGRILEAGSGDPVIGAVVRIGTDYLWASTDIEGEFTFENVESGKHELEASCLGYVSVLMEIDVNKDIENLEIKLH